ncbi:MAG: hypothetical protein Q9M37_00040 [Desulfonauticus sp.]|nr:hypothetical protein [Desulfonauticus sp.]
MSKKWHKLVFKQLQPIHIGMGSYGVISETRIFIPGWTMWGALTKAYNIQCSQRKLSDNQEVFKEISCFYPCFDKQGENPLLPEYKNGEFYLGRYSEDEFRAMFVDTYVSTAIVPTSRMAKDESLHEIDVILPQEKVEVISSGDKKELYWTGIINIDESIKQNFLKTGLIIYVGGDVRYGLGKFKLVPLKDTSDDLQKHKKFFSANYISVKSNNLKKINSQIELIIEIEGYHKNELLIKDREYCFLPGHSLNTFLNTTLNKGKIQT